MINQTIRMCLKFSNDISSISVLSNSYQLFVFRLTMSDLLIANSFDIPKDNLREVDDLGIL